VLEEQCGVTDFEVREEGSVRVYRDFERAGELNQSLVAAGVEVSSMRMSEESLEDHFVKLTGGVDAEEPPDAPARKRGWRR
jgi:bacitracin transport system ATP-binding protein